MKASGKRYASTRGTFVWNGNAEVLGITGDFNGGFAQVNAVISGAVPGVGQWITGQLTIDGVAQTFAVGAYQGNGVATMPLTFGESIRVPQGRHRIGLFMGSGGTPGFQVGGAKLDVTENA